MLKSRITFINNNSLLIDQNTELVIFKYTKENTYNMSAINEFNEDLHDSIRLSEPLTSKSVTCTSKSLSFKILEILHNTDFFYIYDNPKKIFSTNAIFAVEDVEV